MDIISKETETLRKKQNDVLGMKKHYKKKMKNAFDELINRQ